MENLYRLGIGLGLGYWVKGIFSAVVICLMIFPCREKVFSIMNTKAWS